MLAVRVRAQPREGEANAALERLVAKALGLAAARVSVARGGASRTKALELDGVDAAAVERAFGHPPLPLRGTLGDAGRGG